MPSRPGAGLGAPRRFPGASPGGAFSLVEMMVIVILLALLVGQAAVYYQSFTEEQRIQIVWADLNFLKEQIRVHRLEAGARPLTSLEQLRHVKQESLVDPWGHDYCLETGGDPRVGSLGRDGIRGVPGADSDDLWVALEPGPPTQGTTVTPGEPTGIAGESGPRFTALTIFPLPGETILHFDPCARGIMVPTQASIRGMYLVLSGSDEALLGRAQGRGTLDQGPATVLPAFLPPCLSNEPLTAPNRVFRIPVETDLPDGPHQAQVEFVDGASGGVLARVAVSFKIQVSPDMAVAEVFPGDRTVAPGESPVAVTLKVENPDWVASPSFFAALTADGRDLGPLERSQAVAGEFSFRFTPRPRLARGLRTFEFNATYVDPVSNQQHRARRVWTVEVP